MKNSSAHATCTELDAVQAAVHRLVQQPEQPPQQPPQQPPDQSSQQAARQTVLEVSRPARSYIDLPGPRGWPLLGNALQLHGLGFHSQLESWAGQYGSYYRLRIVGRDYMVLSDREAIVRLLRARPEAMRRSSRVSGLIEECGLRSVFTAEGEDWRRQRRLAMRAMTPEVVRRFFPTLARLNARLRRRWQDALEAGQPIAIMHDLNAYALDVVAAFSLGEDFNCLENASSLPHDIEQVFGRVSARLTTLVPYWRYLRLPADRAMEAGMRRARAAIQDCIARARERMRAQPELAARPSNMLEAMLAACAGADSEWHDDDVIGNALIMVFAGEDTSSHTLAWLLDLAARHPEAMARMVEESDRVLGAGFQAESMQMLDRLTYTEAAIKEAMRLKPVAPIIGLEPNQDMQIGDVWVPAGTIVVSLLRHAVAQDMAHDLALEQAQEFRPERWLNAQAGQEPCALEKKLMPFGGGPRFCPGRYLALAQMRMLTSMLMRNFEFRLRPDAAPVEECYTVTMKPSCLPLEVRRRSGER